MKDIDFLPLEYRHRRARRQRNPWRVVVVAGFCGLLGAVGAVDYHRYATEKARLDALMPEYEKTISLRTQLAALQTEHTTAQAEAELYVYVRHPWPRTQILATLVANLPEAIVLEEFEVSRVAPESPSGKGWVARAEQEALEQEQAALPPAARDLRGLRESIDPLRTVVTISGESRDSGPLYHYLAEMNRAKLFAKAELDSIEGDKTSESHRLSFRATILVRPGYGQPGGPIGPSRRPLVAAAPAAPPEANHGPIVHQVSHSQATKPWVP